MTEQETPQQQDISERCAEVWSGIQKEFEDPNNRVIFCEGPAGLGKTYGAYTMAPERFDHLVSLTLGEESSFVELRGAYLLKGMEAVWVDGPMTESSRLGKARLVINEITHAGPDILTGLYPILDSPESARLTLPTGETIQFSDSWHCVITDNQSFERLPSALRDRVDAVCEIRVPAPGILKKVLPSLVGLMVEFVTDEAVAPHKRLGGRGWVRLSRRLVAGQSLEAAAKAVFGSKKAAIVVETITSRLHDGSDSSIESILLSDYGTEIARSVRYF